MRTIDVPTNKHTEFVVLDRHIQKAIDDAGFTNGVVHVYVPHTTAGLTINENADPDVAKDIVNILDKLVPWRGNYAHAEGNSAAHVKASLMGFSEQVLVRDGRLAFGTWQSVYFCEFDGPRRRKVWLSFTAEA